MYSTTVKSERLFQIYSRLVKGDIRSKKELVQQFHITERSIQRNIELLRRFLRNRDSNKISSAIEECAATE